MAKKQVQIRVKNNNRKVVILAPVADSLHASRLADRIDKLMYLKVNNRRYYDKAKYAHISCYTVPGQFSIELLHQDLENMSDLILTQHESIPRTTTGNKN